MDSEGWCATAKGVAKSRTVSSDFCLFFADHVAFQSEKASSKSIDILNMTSAPRLLNVPPS